MALPQTKENNQPNLNTGLGSVAANDNSFARPANENIFPQNTQLKNSTADRISNGLARARAVESATRKMPSAVNDNDDFNEEPENDNESENFAGGGADSAEEETDSLTQQSNTQQPDIATQQQTQLDEEQQMQTAVDLATARQGEMIQIKRQEQEMSQEENQLIKDLDNFKQTRVRRLLSFIQPKITFLIDELVETLKKQAGRLAYKPRISFLNGALTTIKSLIGALRSFKFITAFLDALWSWIKAIIETAETIIGAIVIFLIGFIWVPFMAILFYIGKFPLLKGKMTQQIAEMEDKLKKQEQFWQAQLQKITQIVTKQEQKKALEKQEKQLQRRA